MSYIMIVLVFFVAVLLVYYILHYSCNEKCNNLNKKNIFVSMKLASVKSHFVPVRVSTNDDLRSSLCHYNRTLKPEHCSISSFPNMGYGNGKPSI